MNLKDLKAIALALENAAVRQEYEALAVDWFHGSATPPAKFNDQGGHSDSPDMMFFSRSCNVARRYGPSVVSCSFSLVDIPKISIEDWRSADDSRLPNTDSFVITGDPCSFDFPVDTLVLRSDPGVPFRALRPEEILALDDGLAIEEPISPEDRGWNEFVKDVYDGDEDQALMDMQSPAVGFSPG